VTDYITVSYDIVKIRLNCFTTMLQSAFHRLRPSLPPASRVRVYHFNVWHFHQLRFFCASAFQFAIVYFTLSIVAPQLGNVKCTNVTLNASERTEESDRFQNQRLHLGSKNLFTKIHKMSTSNKVLFLWSDIWSDSINTNDWKFPVCQCSYLIV